MKVNLLYFFLHTPTSNIMLFEVMSGKIPFIFDRPIVFKTVYILTNRTTDLGVYSVPAYGVYIFQFIRYSRACGSY